MAPEVCQSGQAVVRSDIYSLGISLYHMLTGNPPYVGQDIPGILRSHIKGEPLYAERKRPDVSREVGELVRSLTKRDPLVRPDARAVIEELDTIGGKELKQKDTLRGRRNRRRMRMAGKQKSALLVIMLGVAVLAGGLIALLASSGGGGPPKPVTTGGGGTPDPTVPPVSSDPPKVTPPPEPPEVKAAREKREAEERREREGKDAVVAVERWSRENWHGKPDTEAVIARYRSVRDLYKGTAAATEANPCVTWPSSVAYPARRASVSSRRRAESERGPASCRSTNAAASGKRARTWAAGSSASIARPLAVSWAGSRTPTSVTRLGRPAARSSTTYSTSRPCSTARCADSPTASTNRASTGRASRASGSCRM